MLAYLLEHNTKLQWGGERATSACIGIGHLVCIVHTVNLNDNSSSQIIINSGARNAWIVPDSGKQIFSLASVARQGHNPVISGPNPGLFLANSDIFIPFVYTEMDNFFYLPCYPPPSRSNLLVNSYPDKLVVHDLAAFGRERKIEAPWASPAGAKRLSTATQIMRRKVKNGYRSQKAPKSVTKSKEAADPASIQRVHAKLCHVDLRRVIQFKRAGKLIATELPSKFLRAHKRNCPTCMAFKRKLPPKPSALPISTLSLLLPWEHVYVDISGPFRTLSARKNKYYALFVCEKNGQRIFIPFGKRSHFPLVYLEFAARIGLHPKVLYSDLGGELTSVELEFFFVSKGTRHISVPKGEHFSIGTVEKAIQDTDNAIKTTLFDANLPRKYWDVVGEHCNLILQMTSPSRADPNITIFEACYQKTPNLDVIPRVGCFAVRVEPPKLQQDTKLDPRNRSGTFLGYATHKKVFGAVILTDKGSMIIARRNVAFDEGTMPYHRKRNSTDRLHHLNWLIGRVGSNDTAGDTEDMLEVDRIAPDTAPERQLDEALVVDEPIEDDGESSEDEAEVVHQLRNLHMHESFDTPCFNDLQVMRSKPYVNLPEQLTSEEMADDGASSDRQRGNRKRRKTQHYTPSSESSKSSPLSRLANGGKVGFQRAVRTLVRRKAKMKKQSACLPSEPLNDHTRMLNADDIRANKTLLIGKAVKRHFPGHGGAKGRITAYSPTHDSYRLVYDVDGHEEDLPFGEVMKLLPKSWERDQAIADLKALRSAFFAAVADAEKVPNPKMHQCKFTEPKGYYDAERNSPDFITHWKPSFDSEFYTLDQVKKCWVVVDISSLPPNANILSNMWVNKIKYRHGEYERHKSRIVVKGYEQKHGVDFFESFSPTAAQTSVRLLLALTALKGFRSRDFDVTCAFISAPLPENEHVYMHAVEGYPLPEGKCYKLIKTLYGLKQAPRRYYLLVKEVYLSIGMTQLSSDECVFFMARQNVKGAPALTAEAICENGLFESLREVPLDQRIDPSCPHNIMYVAVVVYVDNNGARYNSDLLVEEFESAVNKDGRIELNREGEMDWFLSIRYSCNPETGEVRADQEAYIDSMAERWGMQNANCNKLPWKPGLDLSTLPVPAVPDKYILATYQGICGGLLYVAINTMPDLCYYMHELARYMSRPGPDHLALAKSTLRYVIGNKKRQLVFCAGKVSIPHGIGQIFSFSDSSWADVIPSRKSTFCFLLFCNGAVFSWKSALSSILATSSGVAELLALCAACQEVAWARKFANELGFLQTAPTPLYIDSTAAVKIAEQGSFKGRTKAVDYRYNFVCDYIDRGIVQLHRIPRTKQLADIGTAARSFPEVDRMCKPIYGHAAVQV